MGEAQPSPAPGRGSQINPPNRFERIQFESDDEHLEFESPPQRQAIRTEYFQDASRSIVSENDSPDVGFRYSLNPYRGCAHGCSYCYARPSHEYLGWNAGLDFETKILVKQHAADLFRRWLGRADWHPETIVLSGVTDCFQPAEREFQITRQCLQVACQLRQPISIITKNSLVTRDLDILAEMAEHNTVNVAVSVTTLDQALSKTMEPRTSSPDARLRAITALNDANIPVSAMIAPIIPGLNDSEIPAILEATADAGARSASYTLLRLPITVRPVFLEWLERTHPSRREQVESRIRSCRDGNLSDSRFGRRMRGVGPLAEQIEQTFRVFARRYGLDREFEPLCASAFRSVGQNSEPQLRLFD